MTTTTSRYMTAAETIEYLRLGSSNALYRLINEHRLPFHRMGRHYRFDREEVDAWVHGYNSSLDWARSLRRKIG